MIRIPLDFYISFGSVHLQKGNTDKSVKGAKKELLKYLRTTAHKEKLQNLGLLTLKNSNKKKRGKHM